MYIYSPLPVHICIHFHRRASGRTGDWCGCRATGDATAPIGQLRPGCSAGCRSRSAGSRRRPSRTSAAGWPGGPKGAARGPTNLTKGPKGWDPVKEVDLNSNFSAKNVDIVCVPFSMDVKLSASTFLGQSDRLGKCNRWTCKHFEFGIPIELKPDEWCSE